MIAQIVKTLVLFALFVGIGVSARWAVLRVHRRVQARLRRGAP